MPTDLDVERFTCGDCHILARELSRVTGRPMTFFDPDGDGTLDAHAFITTPDGHYAVDVMGRTHIAEFCMRWDVPEGCLIEASEEQVEKDWGFGVCEYGVYSRHRARQLAPKIARDAGLI